MESTYCLAFWHTDSNEEGSATAADEDEHRVAGIEYGEDVSEFFEGAHGVAVDLEQEVTPSETR